MMLAAIDEAALSNLLAYNNPAHFELPAAYTQILGDLDIISSKRSDFLALVQNFLNRKNLEDDTTEMDPRPTMQMLVPRFSYGWGGAICKDADSEIGWNSESMREMLREEKLPSFGVEKKQGAAHLVRY
jgi:hypothetical protein